MVYISNSEQDTERIGQQLAGLIPAGSVAAMYGELGSGKTALVRGLARGLGLDCRVCSPTFTIVNEYTAAGKTELFHFDMYRLSSADELFDIGWEDYLARGGICAVEWSENVDEAFDGSEWRIVFRKTGDNSREITVEEGKTC